MAWTINAARLARCRPAYNSTLNRIPRIGTTTRMSHTFVLYAPDCTDPDALTRRLSVRETHMEKAKESLGTFLIRGGAMLAPDSDLDAVAAGGPKKMIGSVIFIRGNSLEEVTKKVKEDIYYKSGVWDPEKLVILPYVEAISESK
ncbi:hypothetical protein B0J17DRAFT_648453 [Rhizoctonia solani]|nr:hypothetical protein B0J17DRAFT_648453 [Rhizoctonia solani]